MDECEAHVERYLQHLSIGPVVYEPDGNQPPDFVVDGRIAIEVRRLNQHETSEGRPRGLEETQYPLLSQINGLLQEIGTIKEGPGWFITFHMERPLPEWKRIRREIARWLRSFAERPEGTQSRASFGSLTFSLIPSSTPLGQTFTLGGYTDRDAGGWVLYELRRNVQICIDEKTRKVAPHRARYAEWWLVLVDRVTYGLSELDQRLLLEQGQVGEAWNRVVLLNARDHTSAVQLGRLRAAG